MAQELVLVPKKEYDSFLSKQQKTTTNNDDTLNKTPAVNETVTNIHKSSMNEDLRDDIGAAAVNETINKNHNVNLNESAMEVDSKGAKASKSTMKGAGKNM